MHVTDTIDYAILLQGELVAIMEEGEAVMRAGDILIQRGTNHAWVNKGPENVVLTLTSGYGVYSALAG